MGAVGANITEIKRSTCGFPVTGYKVKYKEAEGGVMAEGGDKQST